MPLNLEDAAHLLGVSPVTLRRWAREGQLGVRRPSGGYRFDERQLRSWGQQHGMKVREAGQAPAALAGVTADEQPFCAALARGGVLKSVQAADRDQLLQAMVDAIPLRDGADRASLLKQLLDRESLTSTGLGEGFAVPHPRTPSSDFVEAPVVLIAQPAAAIDWQALDGQAVEAAFLLVNPNPQLHLKVLSRLAFLLRAEEFQALLRVPIDESALYSTAAQLEPRG